MVIPLKSMMMLDFTELFFSAGDYYIDLYQLGLFMTIPSIVLGFVWFRMFAMRPGCPVSYVNKNHWQLWSVGDTNSPNEDAEFLASDTYFSPVFISVFSESSQFVMNKILPLHKLHLNQASFHSLDNSFRKIFWSWFHSVPLAFTVSTLWYCWWFRNPAITTWDR